MIKPLFWDDSWDNLPQISVSPFPEDLKEKLVSLWGDKLGNYKTKISLEGTQRWVWRSVEGLGLDSLSSEAYEKILLARKIKQVERKDELIWVVSNDERYSVRNGYKALVHSQSWEKVEIPLISVGMLCVFPRQVSFYGLHSRIES